MLGERCSGNRERAWVPLASREVEGVGWPKLAMVLRLPL